MPNGIIPPGPDEQQIRHSACCLRASRRDIIRNEVRMKPIVLLFGAPETEKLLRTLLTNEGYTVRETRDAPTTLADLQTTMVPSLVLFGDYLPGMPVEALLTHLHQHPHLGQRHQFVFLSTQAGALPTSQASLVQALALPVLSLPFQRSVLLALVHSLT